MAPDPLEAEAAGLDSVTATFAGCEWRIPLDVDTWPLTAVKQCVGLNADRRMAVDYGALGIALQELLGEQWEAFIDKFPEAHRLIPASNAFAAAVGIPAAISNDLAFGAIPRLLSVLEMWPMAIESDLDRFWGIDYRDRWRFRKKRRRLTLRQIHARLSNLPTDAGLAVAMGHKSPVELLLMDIYEPLAGRAHPERPLTPEQQAERNAQAETERKAREQYEKRRQQQGHRPVSDRLANARENALRGKKAAHGQEHPHH